MSSFNLFLLEENAFFQNEFSHCQPHQLCEEKSHLENHGDQESQRIKHATKTHMFEALTTVSQDLDYFGSSLVTALCFLC